MVATRSQVDDLTRIACMTVGLWVEDDDLGFTDGQPLRALAWAWRDL